MSVQYHIDQDLQEASAMTKGLDEYVRGTELYGATGGGFFSSSLPSLTIGALVMRLRRLHVLRDRLNIQQQATLDTAQTEFDRVQKEWHVHFTEKITREAHSRLDAMRTFFNECTQNPRSCAGNYPPEMLRRTTVQELLPLIEAAGGVDTELRDKLRSVDGKLRGVVKASDFNWAEVLQPAYPSDPYWWLYQRPSQD